MEVGYPGSIIEYLKTILTVYNNGTQFLFMLAFLVSLIIILILVREKYIKTMLVFPIGLFALLLFNPISIQILRDIRIIPTGRYYRFFWILPIAFTIAFVVTYFIAKFKNRVLVVIFAIIACAAMPLLGDVSVAKERYQQAENIYKVPEYIMEISEVIHNDSEKAQPVLYYDNFFLWNYRVYDPAVISYRQRYVHETINYQKALDCKNNNHPYQVLHYALLAGNHYFITPEEFPYYAEGIDYFILPFDETNIEYFQSCGTTYMGEYGGYQIFKNTTS